MLVKFPLTNGEIIEALLPLDLFESHAAVFGVFRSHPVLAQFRANLSIMTCSSPSAVVNTLVASLTQKSWVVDGRPALLYFLDAIEDEYPAAIQDLKQRLEA